MEGTDKQCHPGKKSARTKSDLKKIIKKIKDWNDLVNWYAGQKDITKLKIKALLLLLLVVVGKNLDIRSVWVCVCVSLFPLTSTSPSADVLFLEFFDKQHTVY